MDNQPKNTVDEAHEMGALAVGAANDPNPVLLKKRLGGFATKRTQAEDLIEPGEHLVTTIHRHVIGVIGIYVEMIVGATAIVAFTVMFLSGTFGNFSGIAKTGILFGGIFMIGFLMLMLALNTAVYRRSKIILTDQSLVTVTQKALFSRTVARLSMSNVEDVTAEQKGILQSIFDFGTLTIQTAGQEDNFIFPLCPKPNSVADKILEARQAYARVHPAA